MDIDTIQGRWIFEILNGVSVETGDEEVFFEVREQVINGYDGCNRFGGNITEPVLIRKSQRSCFSDRPKLPLDLSDPMRQLRRAAIRGDKLILPLPDGNGEAQFRRGS